MIKYGALRREGEEIRFFTTGRPIESGAYVLGGGERPNVHVADSVAALIMCIYPELHAIELEAQRKLSSSRVDEDEAERLAEERMESLVRRLSEDADMWLDEPDWLDDLRPAP